MNVREHAPSAAERSDVKRLIISTVLLLVTALAACSATSGGDADPRTIEVAMTDDLRYDPDELIVRAGETVRFLVRNEGTMVHEFLIGTPEDQVGFEEEMAEGHGGDHEDEVGVSVDPGDMAEFTYTFGAEGEILVGCHQPGHYAGGMVANLTVEG